MGLKRLQPQAHSFPFVVHLIAIGIRRIELAAQPVQTAFQFVPLRGQLGDLALQGAELPLQILTLCRDAGTILSGFKELCLLQRQRLLEGQLRFRQRRQFRLGPRQPCTLFCLDLLAASAGGLRVLQIALQRTNLPLQGLIQVRYARHFHILGVDVRFQPRHILPQAIQLRGGGAEGLAHFLRLPPLVSAGASEIEPADRRHTHPEQHQEQRARDRCLHGACQRQVAYAVAGTDNYLTLWWKQRTSEQSKPCAQRSVAFFLDHMHRFNQALSYPSFILSNSLTTTIGYRATHALTRPAAWVTPRHGTALTLVKI